MGEFGKRNQDQYDDTLAMNSSNHRRMMKISTSHKSINVVRFWDKSQNRGTVKEVDRPVAAPVTDSQSKAVNGRMTFLAGGAGQVISQHDGRNIAVIEEIDEALCLEAVSGFVEAVHWWYGGYNSAWGEIWSG